MGSPHKPSLSAVLDAVLLHLGCANSPANADNQTKVAHIALLAHNSLCKTLSQLFDAAIAIVENGRYQYLSSDYREALLYRRLISKQLWC